MNRFKEQIKNVNKALEKKKGIGCLRRVTKNQFDYIFLETSCPFDYNSARVEKG